MTVIPSLPCFLFTIPCSRGHWELWNIEAIIAISLSQMCSTSQGDHGGDGFFFIKPTYLMMLSDDKIFLLQSSWISSTDQKLQSPVGCIYLDTFLLVNFPYTSILFLFSFTNTLLCSVVPLSPPLTPQLPGQEGSWTLYIAGTGCQPQRLYAAPYSTRGVAFSCFLAGLHGWVLQSLCLRCGTGMQSLGPGLGKCFLLHMLSPCHDLLYLSHL